MHKQVSNKVGVGALKQNIEFLDYLAEVNFLLYL
jgi:hypothetical protein